MDTRITLALFFGFLTTISYGQGKLRLLIVNNFSKRCDERDAHFKCYLSDNASGVTFSSGRVVNTKNIGNVAPTGFSVPENSNIYRVGFASTRHAFGVFSCTATRGGNQTSVQTILLRSNANIVSKDGSLTKTVNADERNVYIEMEKTGEVIRSVLQWRINGSNPIDEHQDKLRYPVGQGRIRNSDHGIYECHYGHHRNDDRQGLQRLIVRGCDEGYWGPPNCYGICDNCYNGGLCDDETGKCICPAGFMGLNCLEACIGKFGYDCEYDCEDNGGGTNDCRGSMFCLLDPFGCRCAPGYEGLGCDTSCARNTFGANCLQECHCGMRKCNAFNGSCEVGCEDGYTGESCQIPTADCKTGYYGTQCLQKCHCIDNEACNRTTGRCQSGCAIGYAVPPGMINCQECQKGYFGEKCQNECHCEGTCDDITGDCTDRQCRTQWKSGWYPYCQTGVASLTFEKTNPNTSTYFYCTVNSPTHLSHIHPKLYRSQPFQHSPSISIVGNWTNTTSRTIQFRVTHVREGEMFYCVLASGAGEDLIVHNDTYLETPVTVYTLPKLNNTPQVLRKTSSSITIRWNTWKESDDGGDGPVIEYIAYYRKLNTFIWLNESVENDDSSSFQAQFSDLDADTEYSFSVAVVRPGPNGEGEKSPEIRSNTSCLAPSSPPVGIRTQQSKNEVNISWRLPKASYIRCRSGVKFVTIYYHQSGEQEENEVDVTNPTTTYFEIHDLKIGISYSLTTTLSTNGGESNRSEQQNFTLWEEASQSGQDSEGTRHNPAKGSTTSPLLIAVIIMAIIDAILGSYFAFLVIQSRQKQATQNGIKSTCSTSLRDTFNDNLKPDVQTSSEPTYQNW